MFDEIIYGFAKIRKIVLYHVPNQFMINVKITVSNMVAHALNSLPGYFWASGK